MKEYNASIRDIPMPDRIKWLPVSDAGYPVPAFVATIDGKPDFRVIERGRIQYAMKHNVCWVCGQPLGKMLAMTIGPMCCINRTISEPPSHRECAVYSALACPFLANPRMRRREVNMPDNAMPMPGENIRRNPGAVAIWVTRKAWPFNVPGGGILFSFADPESVEWYAEGRSATREEVLASITSGLPLLEKVATEEGPAALAALHKQTAAAMKYLPVGA